MTLCMAAACMDRGKPRLVISSDWKVETATYSVENANKFFWIGDSWVCLIAGNGSRALELIKTYRIAFFALYEQKVKISKENIFDLVKQPLIIHKRKLVEEYIGLRLGISYQEFMETGKNRLPEKQFEQMCSDVVNIGFDCWLLLCTFQEGDSFIFRIHPNGDCELCENFAAIGSGTDIAEASFCQREHQEDLPLGQGIFHVYEAAALGARAPGVGESTISVLSPNSKGDTNTRHRNSRG